MPVVESCNCLNGGVCNNTQCICPHGFEGSRCERVETCNSNSCIEPMACIAGKCVCPENSNCSSPCADYPCLNAGTCLNKGTTYQCKCANGFSGKKWFTLLFLFHIKIHNFYDILSRILEENYTFFAY